MPETQPGPKQRRVNDVGQETLLPGDPPSIAAAPEPADPFADLSQFRLSDADLMPGLVEHLAHVPVRKPSRQEFFRLHSDPEMSMPASVFQDSEERETYLVLPNVRPLLVDLLKPVLLTTCITRQKVLLLWG